MKKILITVIIIAFCSINVLTQELTSNVKTTVDVDAFTEMTRIETETWNRIGEDANRNRVNAKMLSTDGAIAVILVFTGDLGCFSKNRSKILVKLTNGEIIEFTQASNTDCSTPLAASFWPIKQDVLASVTSVEELLDLINDNIEKLKLHDWETIRIYGSRRYSDINPTPTRAISNPEQFFRQHIIAIQKHLE